MRIEGQSLTTGGGLIGGGFGAKGAVEGILIATIINRVTTRTRKWVMIDLIADEGWVKLQLEGALSVSMT